MYEPPPIIAELLEDYFAAETALDEEDSGPVLFRGQLVTNETLRTCLIEEATRLGIDDEEMSVAWTHAWNTPPA